MPEEERDWFEVSPPDLPPTALGSARAANQVLDLNAPLNLNVASLLIIVGRSSVHFADCHGHSGFLRGTPSRAWYERELKSSYQLADFIAVALQEIQPHAHADRGHYWANESHFVTSLHFVQIWGRKRLGFKSQGR